MAGARVAKIIPGRTIFFLSDMQTRFSNVVHGFDHVVATCNKMLKVAKILEGFGNTVPELESSLAQLGPLHIKTFDKMLFSLITPELLTLLKCPEQQNIKSVVLMGIESHICVLQTTLDLLENGYDVHVLADGVSSCNKEEVPWALARMRQAGAQITTSESASFQLMADSKLPKFKAFAGVIKEEHSSTKKAVAALLGNFELL